MSFECLLSEISANGVLTLTLNRPKVRNAFHSQMIREISEVFSEIEQNADLRLIVLKGAGPAFCAGADLNHMKASRSLSDEENFQDALAMADMFENVNSCPVPLIAFAQGSAFGGGLGLLSCADSVLATQNCKFAFSEVRLGLIPATIAPFVIGKIGASAARNYFLSGERFSSEVALRLGLIHEVCDEINFEKSQAQRIETFLKAGPKAARAAKQLVHSHEAPKKDLAQWIAALRKNDEAQEGIASLFEKRAPEWVI